MREQYGEELPSLQDVDLEALRKSKGLRDKILSQTFQYLYEDQNPDGSFKRNYATKRDELITNYQSAE